MRISDWSSDVCSSDLRAHRSAGARRIDDRLRPAAPSRRLWHRGAARRQRQRQDRHHARWRRDVEQPEHQYLQPRQAELRSEEHTSELQSLMRISYAVFCLKKKNKVHRETTSTPSTNRAHDASYNQTTRAWYNMQISYD